MKIVSVAQMQAIERSADAHGLTFDKMMHNAGRGIAEWVYKHIPVEQGVIGLVGSGNNGGDTIIALTWLAKWGVRTSAFLAKPRDGDPLLSIYRNLGGAVIDISENENMDLFQAALIPGSVVLDGILGTGLKLPLRGSLLPVMTGIYQRLENRSEVLKIAVDCPSGVDCDNGEVSAVTISADHTLTMAAMKKGLLIHPARSYAGDLHFIGIGINDLSEYITDGLPSMLDPNLIRPLFPQRPDNAHKGTFGTCLVLAGSPPYTGAAYLTGKSAYRAGCGLVNVGTLPEVHQALSGRLIEAVWTILPGCDGGYDHQGVDALRGVISSVDSLVIGPGWGLSYHTADFLQELLKIIPTDMPTLFDADGLKLLARLDEWWTLLPEQVVLTPHPGEMAQLSGLEVGTIQSDRWAIAMEYAHKWQVNLVLKGALSVVASPTEGLFVNPASDAALATAGSGDVLSGLIGGLMAQRISAHTASLLGVWIHASAGKIAGKRHGTDLSVTAIDILDVLPEAFVKAKEAGVNLSLRLEK